MSRKPAQTGRILKKGKDHPIFFACVGHNPIDALSLFFFHGTPQLVLVPARACSVEKHSLTEAISQSGSQSKSPVWGRLYHFIVDLKASVSVTPLTLSWLLFPFPAPIKNNCNSFRDKQPNWVSNQNHWRTAHACVHVVKWVMYIRHDVCEASQGLIIIIRKKVWCQGVTILAAARHSTFVDLRYIYKHLSLIRSLPGRLNTLSVSAWNSSSLAKKLQDREPTHNQSSV